MGIDRDVPVLEEIVQASHMIKMTVRQNDGGRLRARPKSRLGSPSNPPGKTPNPSIHEHPVGSTGFAKKIGVCDPQANSGNVLCDFIQDTNFAGDFEPRWGQFMGKANHGIPPFIQGIGLIAKFGGIVAAPGLKTSFINALAPRLAPTLCSRSMVSPLPRAVFLDRDGTLIEEVEYCRDPALVRILPGVHESLARLKAAGYLNIIVTNQSGIGRGWITPAQYEAVHNRLLALLGPDLITATYFAPDAPGTPSPRRKPAPGMLLEAVTNHGIDLKHSWLVGDKSSDVQCGIAAGVRAVLVETGYGATQSREGADSVAKDFASAIDFILKHSDA